MRTFYRILHPPGESYTEFNDMASAIAWRDLHWPGHSIETVQKPEPQPDAE